MQVDELDYDRRIDAYGKLDATFWSAASPLQATLLLYRYVVQPVYDPVRYESLILPGCPSCCMCYEIAVVRPAQKPLGKGQAGYVSVLTYGALSLIDHFDVLSC